MEIIDGLKWSEDHYLKMVEGVPDYAIILLDKNGIITNWNKGAEKIKQYQEAEAIGKPFQVFYLPSERNKRIPEKLIDEATRTGTANHEGWRLRKDNTRFWARVSLSALHDKDHNVIGFLKVTRDLTERRQSERKLREYALALTKKTADLSNLNLHLEKQVKDRTVTLQKALAKLQRSQLELQNALKMEKELNEIKSRFVTMASHEFRTPLTTILSSASLISKYKQDPEKRDKHTHYIKKSVHHLNNLLEDFLSLGRLDQGHVRTSIESFDLRLLLTEIFTEMKTLLKPRQKMKMVFEGNDHCVNDQNLIKNILINLISNAIKFSKQNQVITISAFNSDLELLLEVKDQGIGIPLDDMPHLFSTFYRATNVLDIEGTGLGLHIVKKHLDILNGTIKLTTHLNGGTIVYVSLPRLSPEATKV